MRFGKKTVPTTITNPITKADALSTGALDMFKKAITDLQEANSLLQGKFEDNEAYKKRLEEEQGSIAARLQTNAQSINKLKDFVPLTEKEENE